MQADAYRPTGVAWVDALLRVAPALAVVTTPGVASAKLLRLAAPLVYRALERRPASVSFTDLPTSRSIMAKIFGLDRPGALASTLTSSEASRPGWYMIGTSPRLWGESPWNRALALTHEGLHALGGMSGWPGMNMPPAAAGLVLRRLSSVRPAYQDATTDPTHRALHLLAQHVLNRQWGNRRAFMRAYSSYPEFLLPRFLRPEGPGL